MRDQFIAHIGSGSNQPFQGELCVRGGEVRSVDMAGSITKINGESVLVAVVRDVSDRKKAEVELALSFNAQQRDALHCLRRRSTVADHIIDLWPNPRMLELLPLIA